MAEVKKNTRLLTLFAGILALVVLFSMAGPVHAQSINIDGFIDGNNQNNPFTQTIYVNTGQTGYDSVPATVIGGQRKVSVSEVSGLPGQNVDAGRAQATNRFRVIASDFAQYTVRMIWDGDDAPWNGTSIDYTGLYTGLNGADLVFDENDVQVADGILLSIVGWDGNAIDINVRVYTDETNYSDATYEIRGTEFVASYDVSLCFFEGCFTATGGSGADFTNVGAIVMDIISVNDGADITIDLSFAGPARDFGDLPESYTTEIASTTSLLDPDEEGARHSRGNIYLGTCVSTELNGQPADNADLPDGDNCDDGIDPVGSNAPGGDGVRWVNGAGGGAVVVTWTSAFEDGLACLDGWINWHHDDVSTGNNHFGETTGLVPSGANLTIGAAAKHVVSGQLLEDNSGYPFEQTVTFAVPANYFDTAGGNEIGLASRWRIYPPDSSGNCPVGGLGTAGYKGYIINGEVEDYIRRFSPTAVTLQSFSPAASNTPVIALVGFFSLAIVAFGVVIVRRERRS